ncbi:BT1926 family outer membrane beta-barrel protein [Saccharicrinis fermentans]|uniref:Outer membrane protein beta-barrel domain-containing protein n=1 Tax=Saccharicrinis fermentans DSM 9555 = JCM 21142 TaxID=869213 RepID=W7YAT7_9BACT|nr:BT1926 family outer membrane beta-barrel protein [Saccharicrinis fermentans]GAF04698.1 hypothetical protein JCM21142_93414 [Saccharicrinis fermentans DSM 9555 = JCM 21142]
MKNKNIIYSLFCVFVLCWFSTNMEGQNGEYTPQSGDKIVSLKFGRLKDYGEINGYYVNRIANGSSTSVIDYPTLSTDDPSATISIIGVEVKYFLSPNIALRFGGGGALAGVPSRDYVPGVSVDGSSSPYSIPSYSMLEGKTTMEMYGDLGADYYFSTKVNRLFPYLGGEVNGVYSQMEIFDGFRGVDSNDEVIDTYDTRRGEAYAFGGGINGGVDYYIAPGLFIGMEVKVASYMYAVKTIFPQPGLDAQEADAHNFSFLSQPVIKLGFKF